MNKALKLGIGSAMLSLLVACGNDEQKAKPVEPAVKMEEESKIPQNQTLVSQVEKKKTALINGKKFVYDAPVIKPGVALFDAKMNEKTRVTQQIVVVITKAKQVSLTAARHQLSEFGQVKALADDIYEISFDTDTDMLEKYNAMKSLPFLETVELQLRSNPRAEGNAEY